MSPTQWKKQLQVNTAVSRVRRQILQHSEAPQPCLFAFDGADPSFTWQQPELVGARLVLRDRCWCDSCRRSAGAMFRALKSPTQALPPYRRGGKICTSTLLSVILFSVTTGNGRIHVITLPHFRRLNLT
jgi:hypothetical protein